NGQMGGFRPAAVTEARRSAGLGPRGGAALANDRQTTRRKHEHYADVGTADLADRRHPDPAGSAAAELHRRDLPDRLRADRAVRSRQHAPAMRSALKAN